MAGEGGGAAEGGGVRVDVVPPTSSPHAPPSAPVSAPTAEASSAEGSSPGARGSGAVELRRGFLFDETGFRRMRLSDFSALRAVGKGVYATVYHAVEKRSGRDVALKKLDFSKYGKARSTEGFPRLMVVELHSLQLLAHMYVRESESTNVVDLLGVVVDHPAGQREPDLYLVMEYLPYQLSKLGASRKLTKQHIRCYMKQVAKGLSEMHANGIIHRDLKGDNVLVGRNNVLKIGDLGMARRLTLAPMPENGCPWAPGVQRRPVTTAQRVTLWYRAPEIMFGDEDYGPASDIWSAGILFLELLNEGTVSQAETVKQQMQWIYSRVGMPTEERWPGVSKLPRWVDLKPKGKEAEALEKQPLHQGLRNKYPRLLSMYPEEMKLICSMLQLDPSKRPTAFEIIHTTHKSLFFDPDIPVDPAALPPMEYDDTMEDARAQKQRKLRERVNLALEAETEQRGDSADRSSAGRGVSVSMGRGPSASVDRGALSKPAPTTGMGARPHHQSGPRGSSVGPSRPQHGRGPSRSHSVTRSGPSVTPEAAGGMFVDDDPAPIGGRKRGRSRGRGARRSASPGRPLGPSGSGKHPYKRNRPDGGAKPSLSAGPSSSPPPPPSAVPPTMPPAPHPTHPHP